jgi:phenylpyruvate tautomerase PptA (4-oxalocrotonate tautomerase family)
VQVLKGHASEVKTRLSNLLTDAFRMVIAVPHSSITIVIEEFERENFMRGGALSKRAQSHADPFKVIEGHSRAFERGDFDEVRKYLADDCVYILPGGVEHTSPEDAVEWLAKRTPRFAFDRRVSEVAAGERGPVVYSRGVLSGRYADGAEYENVRIVVRYELAGDKIISINAWNDLRPPARPET